jgi:hypothetical protein
MYRIQNTFIIQWRWPEENIRLREDFVSNEKKRLKLVSKHPKFGMA